MERYFAFLRAINVGGRSVEMNKLSEIFEKRGLEAVDTYIASGNVLFESETKDTAALTSVIEKNLKKSLGFDVPTFFTHHGRTGCTGREQSV